MATLVCGLVLKKCNPFVGDPEKENKEGLTMIGCMAFDTIASISALVLAILGTINILQMPVPAWGALYGVTGTISLAWVALLIKNCIK